jgi:hypothetical protein
MEHSRDQSGTRLARAILGTDFEQEIGHVQYAQQAILQPVVVSLELFSCLREIDNCICLLLLRTESGFAVVGDVSPIGIVQVCRLNVSVVACHVGRQLRRWVSQTVDT